MAANTQPIFIRIPDNSSDGTGNTQATAITTATGDFTGVSANHSKVFTAGTAGAWVDYISFKALGTNVVSVARIYSVLNGLHTDAANNSLIGEQALIATTSSNTAPTSGDIIWVANRRLAPLEEIWVGLGTTVASGYDVKAFGGQY